MPESSIRCAFPAAVVVLLAAGGCSRDTARLRVGYTEFRPYVTVDEHGEPSGLAVQTVQEAAARTGVELQWIHVDNAERALRSGEIDLFPLQTVTPERQRDLYFSAAWWDSSQSLLSLRGRPLRTTAAVAGKRIAVRDPAFGVPAAAQQLAGAELVPMRDIKSIIADVCAGAVDGALLDGRLIHEGLLDQSAECAGRKLLVTPMPGTASPMATVATRAVRATADRLYSGIDQLALDGTITRLANRWLAVPQQHYVEQSQARRQRLELGVLLVAGALIIVGLNVWHWRHTAVIRSEAQEGVRRAREAEHRFETFMAHSPAVAFIKDGQGRYCYINQAFTANFGLSAGAVYGKTDADLWPLAVAQAANAVDLRILDTGEAQQYVQAVPSGEGVRHWLVLKFRLGGGSEVFQIGGTAIDVTAQQRATELVAENEERYRLLFEQAPVAIHEIDSSGAIRRVNRAECALLGFPAEEMLGRHASDFVAPEAREASVVLVREKLLGMRPLTPFERVYQTKDGRTLTMEVHEAAIYDAAGAIQGLRTCMVDLTERKRAESLGDAFADAVQSRNQALEAALETAQAATTLKSQFLATMSHEIRTPMNAILGLTELLLNSSLTPEQYALARNVCQSGEHLMAIINDILDLSKIEAGKLELEHLSFDTEELIGDVVDLMAVPIQTRGVELSAFVAPEVPPRLMGDPARLRQVLLNLVGNAAKFTSKGEVSVRVTCERLEAGRATLRFAVADTGIGIPADVQPRLFDAFTQADSSTTRQYGGTGLGLAIVKRIVQLMRGEVGLESVEGQGSTFWFLVKLDCDPTGPRPPTNPSLSGVRVLIVGDNATSCAILDRYARSWGMQPEAADSGQSALPVLRTAALNGKPFALALIDVRMPAMDGAALAREIHRDERIRATQLVMLSSARALPIEGLAARLTKPIKRRALFDCLSGLTPGPSNRQEAGAEPTGATPASKPRGRILIAEDNVVNQRVAGMQVRHFGFEADVVANGEEALTALERHHYCLVLMDCHMPVMDGYAATREIRRRENGRRTPVIAMTADAYASDRQACLDAGMDDFISKPVALHDIGQVLERWVQPETAS
ncbi:MAG TPA: response regulator [Bryobacteraceae bacterium]|nr:response regulator [Bryobacteraceae bacterium]